jgi:hypothetical protein
VTRKGVDMQPEIEDIRSRFSCKLGLSPRDAELLKDQLEKLSDALATLDLERTDQAMQSL